MNTNYRAVCAFKWLTVLMPSLGQVQKWHWRKGNFILFFKKYAFSEFITEYIKPTLKIMKTLAT